MRKATTLLAILASLFFYAFAFSTPASADPGGNNGDVKIHDTGTAVEDHRNEPHVCSFYIDGFNFDGGSRGTWRIEGWAPTGSGVKSSNSWGPADAKGNWHSNNISLPDGHYKLFAKQTSPQTPGGEKQKVFWVECGMAGGTGPTGNTNGGNSSTSANLGTGNNAGGNSSSGSSSSGNSSSGSSSSGSSSAGTTAPGSQVVAGSQSSPNNAVGAVTPIVELPGGSIQQSPNTAVNGMQTSPVAGVQSLPSTSTAGTPAVPLVVVGISIIALGGALLRRKDLSA